MSELGAYLIHLVRHTAADNPDFVYIRDFVAPDHPNPCMYVRDNNPACLIGHAFWAAGLIDASLADDSINTATVLELSDVLDLPVDEVEVQWLRRAQREQDFGGSWGVAVATADVAVPLGEGEGFLSKLKAPVH